MLSRHSLLGSLIVSHSLSSPMSFFSHASGVNINGGTFYSSARDVNIQNNVQLAIENESQAFEYALEYAGAPDASAAQNVIEDRQFAGPQRSGGYASGTERFSPYRAFKFPWDSMD